MKNQTKWIVRLMLIGMITDAFVGTSVAGGQSVVLVPATSVLLAKDTTIRRRPRAIEYSDWYARRLTIHRIGSYTMLPLFGAEYYLGQKLLNGEGSDTERSAHVAVAAGLGTLFTINTVTGVWNLVESRKDPADRTRRLIHSALMIGADAGFAWAGAIGGDARESGDTRSLHKNIAIGSMGLSAAGVALMWFWNK